MDHAEIDIGAVRERLGLTQEQLAWRYGSTSRPYGTGRRVGASPIPRHWAPCASSIICLIRSAGFSKSRSGRQEAAGRDATLRVFHRAVFIVAHWR
jgi:hypothetical protein